MRYIDFKHKLQHYPIFSSNLFEHLTANPAVLRRQVTEWCHKGYLTQLKRGLYTFSDVDHKANFSQFFLANQLYQPSYVSLESALSYYGIIPEKVVAITSVTTRKTKKFINQYGSFTFQHIKPELFDNFRSMQDEFGNTFNIASAERAVVDFFYLRLRTIKHIDADIFTQSHRLQNLEILNLKYLREITACFNQKKLTTVVNLLLSHVK